MRYVDSVVFDAIARYRAQSEEQDVPLWSSVATATESDAQSYHWAKSFRPSLSTTRPPENVGLYRIVAVLPLILALFSENDEWPV